MCIIVFQMSNPPPRKSRRVQARRRRGARSDVETSGVTPGTASERPHSVPTQPMVQGSVEPPTVGTLPGQSSMEDFMRGVSKAVEAGIQATISPLLQLMSQQGEGNLSSSPPAGRQNAEDMPPPPATSGGAPTWCCGLHSHKGPSGSWQGDASPGTISTTYSPKYCGLHSRRGT